MNKPSSVTLRMRIHARTDTEGEGTKPAKTSLELRVCTISNSECHDLEWAIRQLFTRGETKPGQVVEVLVRPTGSDDA